MLKLKRKVYGVFTLASFLSLSLFLSLDKARAEDKIETMEKRLSNDSAIRRQKLMRDGRLELGLSLGSSLGDTYRRSFPIKLHTTYFISDQLGIGLNAFYALTSETSLAEDVRALRPRRVAKDSFSAVSLGVDLDVQYVPLHGKLSLLGISAIRYDLGLTGGIGLLQINGAQQDGFSVAPALGLNGRFYFNDQMALGVFYKSYIYPHSDRAAIIDGAPVVDSRWSPHGFGGLMFSFMTGKPGVGYE